MKRNLIKVISVLLLFSGCTFTVAERVIQHEEFSADDVQNIKVESSSGDLKIIQGGSSKVIVETYSNQRRVAEAKIDLSGNTLFVDTTVWSFNLKQPDIRIFLPRDFEFDNLDLKLSSGNVEIDNVDCEEININLTSSNVDIDDSVISGDIKVKSTSGNIEVDDVVCANFKAELTSGNIEAENITCDIFDAESTSGRIVCEDLICKKVMAEAKSGNVTIELTEMTSQKSSLKTSSGNVTLILPKDNDGYSATVNTSAGTFKDEFTGMKANNCTGSTSVYKEGGVEFELTAKSGTVKIQKAR